MYSLQVKMATVLTTLVMQFPNIIPTTLLYSLPNEMIVAFKNPLETSNFPTCTIPHTTHKQGPSPMVKHALQRLDELVHLSQVQLWLSHTRNTEDVLAASTRLPSGDQVTAPSPPPIAMGILVATPNITSHTTRWASTGEAETSRSPWGLQDKETTAQWPGTVSVRTQEERSLGTRGW